MTNGSVERIQVDVSRRLFRAMQFRPLALLVGALTGVSITFSPALLFYLGSQGAPFLDWRVIACFAVTYLVPLVYVRFGGAVLQVAWKRRDDPTFGAPGGGAAR